jgi:hypothetical protein
LGSINSFGTTPLTLLLGLSLGGEGFIEYSVKLNVFKIGVLGLPFSNPFPLTTTPFSISASWFPFLIQLIRWKGGGELVVVESKQ